MITLRATRNFKDLEAGVYRLPGEEFDVTEQRAKVILAAGVAETVEAKPKDNKPKKSTKKKG